MSTVVRFPNRRDRTATRPVEIDTHEIQSLSQSWQSITASVGRFQNYVDDLKLRLDALPDGPEKARASLQIKQFEQQIRDCLAWSAEATAAVVTIKQFI